MMLCFLRRGILWEKTYRAFLDDRDRKRRSKELNNSGSGKGTKKRGIPGPETSVSSAVGSALTAGKRNSKKINYDALQVY